MIRDAQIIFNRGNSTVVCTVVDFTDVGAAVKPIPGTSLPRFILLDLGDGRRFDCEIVDRTKGLIELQFAK